MLDLAERMAPGAAAVHEPERPGDVRRLLADSTAAREALGFEPRVSFDEGLALLAEWYELQKAPASVLLQQEVVHNWRSR
jgi:nucleoside-diphosphate-sugar epimerase